MTEPSNTEIKTLLERHMTDSAAREERAIDRTSRLSGTVEKLSASVLELHERVGRVERERENTHQIARKALESNHDLEGVVTREVSALQTSNAAQNVQIAAIKAEVLKQTPQLNELLAESHDGKVQRDLVLKLIKASPVVFTGIAGLLAGLVWLIAHAH